MIEFTGKPGSKKFAHEVGELFKQAYTEARKQCGDEEWWNENVAFVCSTNVKEEDEKGVGRAIAGSANSLIEMAIQTIEKCSSEMAKEGQAEKAQHVEFMIGLATSIVGEAADFLEQDEEIQKEIKKSSAKHGLPEDMAATIGKKAARQLIVASLLQQVSGNLGLKTAFGSEKDGRIEKFGDSPKGKKQEEKGRPDF